MKLIRFGERGGEKPGVLLDGNIRVSVADFVRDFDEGFFANDGITHLTEWLHLHGADAPRIDPGQRWASPFARPSKIICVGLNFRDHAEESKMDIPTEPVLFSKATSAVAGPHDNVVIPKGAEKLDWEVELAVVIGREARHVPVGQAYEHVAGYVLHNDYSERSFQLERGGQWVKGKSADTFAPIGPFLATRDEIPNPGHLRMWLKVNGEYRQQSSTVHMVFGVPKLLSYISEFMTLLPGDVISTGTPAGVGLGMRPPQYLRPGDVVELGIDGLGTSRQTVTAWT
jgi:2,4-didehydro-3-deoxy-L-rhamnonate hydrolase